MNIDKRKLYGTLIGSLAFLAVILAFTYARYIWRSSDTNLSFNISDEYFYCESGFSETVTGLSPVSNYRENLDDVFVQEFMVNNIGKSATTFSVSMKIDEATDSSLFNSSLKYKLVVDKSGGSNICTNTSVSGCVDVASGDFSEFSVGMNTLAEVIELPNNVRYQYYLFVYIDGNVQNSVSMQNKNLVFTLDVCEIVVFFDYNGGNKTLDFLKVTSSYDGLPTPTHNDTVITYNSNGGTTPSSNTIKYNFGGWYLSQEYLEEDKIEGDDLVAKTTNHTLFTKWNPQETSGTSNDGCVTLPTTTRTGHTFNGWYSNEGLTTKVGNAGATYCITPENKSHTLYAKWTINQYELTLEKGTGILDVTQSGTGVYDYGTTVTISATVMDGYTWKNWTGTGITGSNSNQYTFTIPANDATLKANAADETKPSATLTTTNTLKSVRQTATLTCNDSVGVTKYYFGTNASPSDSDYTTITSTKSMSQTATIDSAGTWNLYCKDNSGNISDKKSTVINSYTVNNLLETIDGTTGVYTSANYTSATSTTYLATSGTTITLASVYTVPSGANASTFKGYSTGYSTTAVTPNTTAPVLTANTTYYMWFNRAKYTLTLNKGTGIASVTGAGTYKYGRTVNISASPSEGYEFTNWTVESGDSPTSTTNASTTVTITQATTLKANTDAITYTINYYLGNGVSTAGAKNLGTSTCVYNTSCTLTTFSDLGETFPESSEYSWTFNGWSTSSNGMQPSTINNTELKDGETVVYNLTRDINLYAVGKRTLSFYSGTTPTKVAALAQYWNPYSSTSTYLSDITIPEATNITGWTFQGWLVGSSVPSANVTYSSDLVGTSIKPAHNSYTKYRSVYSRNLTIAYNGNDNTGGSTSNTPGIQYYNSGVDSTNKRISEATFTLATNGFTKTGNTFNKWAEGSASGTQYAQGATYKWTPAVDDATVTKTMYATWTKNTAAVTIKKDGSAYSGLTVALYQSGTSKYASPTYASGVYTFNEVADGTYDVYEGGKDTGTNVTVSTTGSATINYYSLTLNKGIGISSVSGAGNYINGTSATINATASTGYTFKNWTVESGNSPTSTTNANTTITISQKTTLTANGQDVNNPTASITNISSSLKSVTQTTTLTCKDAESGITGYYFGTTAPSDSTTYTNVTTAATVTKTGTINSAGTWYLACKDVAGNTNSTSTIIRSYTINNYLLSLTGTKGVYTTTHYPQSGTTSSTYIIPNGTTMTLSTLYADEDTIPTHAAAGTFKGYSTGAAGETASTLVNTNPVINANTTYNMWFDRSEFALTLNKGTGIFSVSGANTYRSGATASISTTMASGYTFKNWTGTGNTPVSSTSATTTVVITQTTELKANAEDITAPTATMTVTSTLNETSQTATLSCTDSVGVISYYWGTTAPTSSSSYTTVTATTSMTRTATITAAGTYYFACKDVSTNTSTTASKAVYSYTVNNYLLTTTGTKGTYTTSNYNKVGNTSSTYYLPAGSTVTLASVYTIPKINNVTLASNDTFQGYSTGTAPSTGGATVSTTNPTISANTTYNMWFDRLEYTLTLTKGTGISAVTIGGNTYSTPQPYRVGASVTIDATVSSGYEWANWSGTYSTTIKNYTFTMPSSAVNLTANTSPNAAPTAMLGITDEMKATEQTAVLYCEDNSNVKSFYFGNTAPSDTSTYVELEETAREIEITENITAAGTYYLSCKDELGNISETSSVEVLRYTVNNLLLKADGTAGQYTTGNYETVSTGTYIAPTGSTLVITESYTVPSVAKPESFKGLSTSATSYSSAGLTNENPTIKKVNLWSNLAYYMWFDRDQSNENSPEITELSLTNNMKATTQIATLKCTDPSGVNGYYFGTDSSPELTDYTTITTTTSMSQTATVNSAGTWYLYCKDGENNVSSPESVVLTNYTVNNLLLKEGGTAGDYTSGSTSIMGGSSGNYESVSTHTYMLPVGATIILTQSYTIPAGSSADLFKGVSTAAGSSWNKANPTMTNATLSSSGYSTTTYYMWFDRDTSGGGTTSTYTVTLNKGTGISAVTQSGTGIYTVGETVTINATVDSGYTWSKWTGTYDTTAQNYTFEMPASNVTLTANAITSGSTTDTTKPVVTYLEITSTLKETSQTATLKCSDNKGVTGYYFGKTAPSSSSTYTEITSTTSMTQTATVDSAGTWYLACKDAAGNVSESTSEVINSYVVNNLIQKSTGTAGQYTYSTTSSFGSSGNYELGSTATYIAPNGTRIILTSIYTIPTNASASTFKGYSTTATRIQSATVSLENTILSNNATYYMWFDRSTSVQTYTVTLTAGDGISGVTGAGSYATGATVTINATVQNGYTWSKWTGYTESTSQRYTFTMPSSNVSFTATAASNATSDTTAPVVTGITTTNTLKETSKVITLKCTDTVGVTGYYFGNTAPTQTSSYTEVTSTTSMTKTATVTAAGTYYLACIDAKGNTSSSGSITINSYVVNNLVQKEGGTAGTYTYTTSQYYQSRANYELGSTATYLAPTGTTITLTSVYTIPDNATASTFKGYSTSPGTVNYNTSTSATVTTTNPTLSSNATYYMWFDRAASTTADTTAPVVTGVTTTNTLKETSKVITLKCTDNKGVTGYYFGTTAPSTSTTYTSVTSTTSMTKTATITAAGTYYLACRDAATNTSSSGSITINSYVVNNLVQKEGGTAGKYIYAASSNYTTHYELGSTATYLAQSGTTITLTSVYTVPSNATASTFKGYSTSPGTTSWSGGTSATVTTSNPTLSSNATYYMWFDRTASATTYTVTLNKGTGISAVTQSGTGTYTAGSSVTINATLQPGYTWSKWTGSFETTTQNYTFTVNSNVTLTANATSSATADTTAPVVTGVTTTNTLKETSKVITLKCTDNKGVTGYYFGTTAPSTSTTYTSVTSTTSMTKTATVTSAGTYYLACRDAATNTSSSGSITINSYVVNNLVQKEGGTAGKYIYAASSNYTTHYELGSTATYLAQSGTTITLTSVYTVPSNATASTFKGYSTSPGTTSWSGGTSATVTTSNPTLSSNATYYMWFDRTASATTYTVTLNKGTGISAVTQSGTGTYTAGSSVTINATLQPGYTWSKWTGSFETTTQNYTFTVNSNVTLTANATSSGGSSSTYTINYYLGKGTSTAGTTKLGTSTCTANTSCTLTKFEDLDGTFPGSSYSWFFKGWSTSQTGTTISTISNTTLNDGVSFTTSSTNDINLYAVGKRNISFYSGTTPTKVAELEQLWNPYSTSNTYLSNIVLPSATTITGWTFHGWLVGSNVASSNVTYGSSNVGSSVKPAYNTYATYRSVYSRTLTISYNGNGNTGGTTANTTESQYFNCGVDSSTSAVNNVTFTLANNGFTKTGYTFNKWADGSATGTQYSAGTTYTWGPGFSSSTTKTMYATWNSSSTLTASVTVASALKKTSATATLKCTGGTTTSYYWGTSSSPTSTSYTTVTATTSMTKYATITAAGTYYLYCKNSSATSTAASTIIRSYTVINYLLNVAGAAGTYTTSNYKSSSTATYYIPNGATITLSSVYTAPTGATTTTFKGYTTGNAGTTSVTPSTTNPVISANTTYNMWFNRLEYTVTLKAGTGGKVVASNQRNTSATATSSASKTLTFRYGETLSATASVTTTGYQFTGWSGISTATTASISNVSITSAGTLTGNFGAGTYTVKYDCNGGTGSPAAVTHTVGVAKNLNAGSVCSKSGSTFTKWNTNSGGTGTSYNSEQSVTNIANAGATVTLYAQWAANKYSVTTAGGSLTYRDTLADAVSAVNSGGTITLLQNLTDDAAVTVSKSLTFNTGSYTLTRTNNNITLSSGTFTKTGSGGITVTSGGGIACNSGSLKWTAGTLSVGGASNNAIYMANGPTVEISGGVIKGTNTSSSHDIQNAKGTLNIKAGSVSGVNGGINNIDGVTTISGTAVINVSGDANIYNNGQTGTINISGGTIGSTTSTQIAIHNNSPGAINISGGKINCGSSGNSCVINQSTGNINMTSGTITAKATAMYNKGTGTVTIGKGETSVSISTTPTLESTAGTGEWSTLYCGADTGSKAVCFVQAGSRIKSTKGYAVINNGGDYKQYIGTRVSSSVTDTSATSTKAAIWNKSAAYTSANPRYYGRVYIRKGIVESGVNAIYSTTPSAQAVYIGYGNSDTEDAIFNSQNNTASETTGPWILGGSSTTNGRGIYPAAEGIAWRHENGVVCGCKAPAYKEASVVRGGYTSTAVTRSKDGCLCYVLTK